MIHGWKHGLDRWVFRYEQIGCGGVISVVFALAWMAAWTLMLASVTRTFLTPVAIEDLDVYRLRVRSTEWLPNYDNPAFLRLSGDELRRAVVVDDNLWGDYARLPDFTAIAADTVATVWVRRKDVADSGSASIDALGIRIGGFYVPPDAGVRQNNVSGVEFAFLGTMGLIGILSGLVVVVGVAARMFVV